MNSRNGGEMAKRVQRKQDTERKTAPNITIRDVAKIAGVSIGTVSRVVTGATGVSPKRTARVKEAIEQLGYQPNSAAQSLRNKATGFLGFLVPDLSNPIYAAHLAGAELRARESGYSLIVGTTGNDPFRERNQLKFLAGGRVDGAVMLIGEDTQPTLGKAIADLARPAVVVERYAPASVNSVCVDHRAATRAAVAYLISLGHKRLALLTSAAHIRATIERVAAVREAWAEAGLASSDLQISTDCTNSALTYSVANALLGRPDRPTAIISIASGLAGSLRAIKAHGLSIPRNISLLCIGNTDLTTLVSPSVTCLSWDLSLVGKTAVDLLLNRITVHAEASPHRILMQSELILRESCASPQ